MSQQQPNTLSHSNDAATITNRHRNLGTLPTNTRTTTQGLEAVENGHQEQKPGMSKTQKAWSYITDTYYMTSTFPVLAMIFVYVGCVNFVPDPEHDIEQWKDISKVSAVYGPGALLTWVWTVNCQMYDVYRAKKAGSWCEPPKVLGTIVYAAYALGDLIMRAWRKDFGPEFGAARYVTDKAFESLAMVYVIWWFQRYDVRSFRREDGVPFHHGAQSAYLNWPCWMLMALWVASQLLTLLETKYYVPQRHEQFAYSWDPCIPREYRALTCVFGLSVATLLNKDYSADGSPSWWSNSCTGFWKGLPLGFWLSQAILHSGIYGTISPFRLTAIKFEGVSQIGPVAIAIVISITQYREDIRAVFRKFGHCLQRLAHSLRIIAARSQQQTKPDVSAGINPSDSFELDTIDPQPIELTNGARHNVELDASHEHSVTLQTHPAGAFELDVSNTHSVELCADATSDSHTIPIPVKAVSP